MEKNKTSRDWFVLMAGEGKRTQHLGPYKPFITVADNEFGKKYVIECCIEGILESGFDIEKDKMFFVFTEKQENEFNCSEVLSSLRVLQKVPKVRVFTIQLQETKSQLETFLAALTFRRKISEFNDRPCDIVAVNADQYNVFQYKIKDGCVYLPAYINTENTSAFFTMHMYNPDVVQTMHEKVQVSSIASSGVFIFSSYLYKLIADENYKDKINELLLLNENGREPTLTALINFLITRTAMGINICSTRIKIDLGSEEGILWMREKEKNKYLDIVKLKAQRNSFSALDE